MDRQQPLGAGQLRLERLEHLRDRDGAEHDVGLAGLGGLRCALVEAGLGGRDERLEVEPGQAGGRGGRVARAVDLGGGERALLERRHAARRDDRDARRAGAQLDHEPVAGGVAQLAGHVGGVEREHGGVPAGVRPARLGIGEPARLERLAVELGVRRRGGGGAGEPRLAEVGRRRRAHVAVAQHDELGGLLDEVGDPVLADGEPALPPDGRLALAVEPARAPAGRVR